MSSILQAVWHFALVAAGTFAVLVAATSVLRFQRLTHRLQGAEDASIDSGDAFRVRIMANLGTVHRAPEPFVVGSARIADAEILREQYGDAGDAELIEYVQRALKSAVREGDIVHVLDRTHFGLVLQCERTNAAKIGDRLIEMLTKSSFRCSNGLFARPRIHLGMASFPENGQRVEELVATALQAMQDHSSRPETACVLAASEEAAAAEDQAPEETPPSQERTRLQDELTGVLRQERMGPALQKFVARYRKEGLPVSFVALDIDDLNQYNNHYSREAGDAVLQSLAHMIESNLRVDDLIARYEGDQFIVALGCSAEAALKVAQRLALAAKRQYVRYGTTSLKITLCAGVAGAPEDGRVARELFECAQAALAEAKRRGRNICVRYEQGAQHAQQGPAQTEAF